MSTIKGLAKVDKVHNNNLDNKTHFYQRIVFSCDNVNNWKEGTQSLNAAIFIN